MENNLQTQCGILARLYLTTKKANTYDLREFEYFDKHDTILKIDCLLRAVEFFQMSELEKNAFNFVKNSGETRMITEKDFILELMKNE